jgi:hypothetical protein
MWDLSVEAAMAKIEDAYVKNFDDDRNWIYMVWMNLTAFGQQLGLELYHADDPATKPRQIASAPSDPDSEGAPRGMNACRTKVWRGYRAICPLGDTSPAMMLPMIATPASTLAPAVLPASARLWAKSGTNDDPPGAALRDG